MHLPVQTTVTAFNSQVYQAMIELCDCFPDVLLLGHYAGPSTIVEPSRPTRPATVTNVGKTLPRWHSTSLSTVQTTGFTTPAPQPFSAVPVTLPAPPILSNPPPRAPPPCSVPIITQHNSPGGLPPTPPSPPPPVPPPVSTTAGLPWPVPMPPPTPRHGGGNVPPPPAHPTSTLPGPARRRRRRQRFNKPGAKHQIVSTYSRV